MNNRIPTVLSLIGGYVDTASYLALHGLFAAHVTGNFVTLGASLVMGRSGAIAKLLALPVFCLIVAITRLISFSLVRRGLPALRTMLSLKLVLLLIAAIMAIELGPFADGDSLPALATGMTLVAAMAIQNAAHRIHISHAPPSTLMTGTTTQIMIDIADLLHGAAPEAKAAARARLPRMATSVLAFAIGCGAAALLFSFTAGWCFVIPPALSLFILLDLSRVEEGNL